MTTGYGAMTAELAVLKTKVTGAFSFSFWAMILCMRAAVVLLLLRRQDVITMTTAASALIVVGMWLERFTIIVPTLTKPFEEGYRFGLYRPTLTEWLISTGSLACFVLLLAVFARFFPVISLWEIEEARGEAAVMASAIAAPRVLHNREMAATD